MVLEQRGSGKSCDAVPVCSTAARNRRRRNQRLRWRHRYCRRLIQFKSKGRVAYDSKLMTVERPGDWSACDVGVVRKRLPARKTLCADNYCGTPEYADFLLRCPPITSMPPPRLDQYFSIGDKPTSDQVLSNFWGISPQLPNSIPPMNSPQPPKCDR